MKVSHYLSLSFLILTFASQTFSQSVYLEKGQSGIGVLGDFSSNQSASATGGSLGYSINSILDVGLSISNISPLQKLDGREYYAAAIALSITLTAVKQDPTNPISLAFSAADLSYKYTSPALDQNSPTTEPTGFSIGASVYRNITVSPAIELQPQIGISYARVNAEVKDTHGNPVIPGYNSAVFDVGLSLLFHTGPTTLIGISPSVGKDKYHTTFDLAAGFVFIL